MCGWYSNTQCQLERRYGMVLDGPRRVYLYLTESYRYTNCHEYLFINGEHDRVRLQSISGLHYYSYC